MMTPVFSAELNIDMDNLKEFEKDTDVAVSDVNFTIPKGFYDLGYVDLSEYDDFWGEADSKIYANEDGDGIGVIVASHLLGYTLDDLKDNLEDCEEKNNQ